MNIPSTQFTKPIVHDHHLVGRIIQRLVHTSSKHLWKSWNRACERTFHCRALSAETCDLHVDFAFFEVSLCAFHAQGLAEVADEFAVRVLCVGGCEFCAAGGAGWGGVGGDEGFGAAVGGGGGCGGGAEVDVVVGGGGGWEGGGGEGLGDGGWGVRGWVDVVGVGCGFEGEGFVDEGFWLGVFSCEDGECVFRVDVFIFFLFYVIGKRSWLL